MIGFSESDAEEVFDTMILTGSQTAAYLNERPPLYYLGRSFCYDEFDPELIRDEMTKRIMACSRDDDTEAINELRKILYWDFEDMSMSEEQHPKVS